jgi:hypothetical protein
VEPELKDFCEFIEKTGVQINQDIIEFYELFRKKGITFDSKVLELYTACTSQKTVAASTSETKDPKTEWLNFYKFVYSEEKSFDGILDFHLALKNYSRVPKDSMLVLYKQLREKQLKLKPYILELSDFLDEAKIKPSEYTTAFCLFCRQNKLRFDI